MCTHPISVTIPLCILVKLKFNPITREHIFPDFHLVSLQKKNFFRLLLIIIANGFIFPRVERQRGRGRDYHKN